MRKICFIGLLVFVVLISGCTYGPAKEPAPAQPTTQPAPTTTPQPGTANLVDIKGFAFDPATITISKGTTVTWTNNDGVSHTVTGSGFDSGTLKQGQTFNWTFNEAGTFEYGCSIHTTMAGKVIVT